MCLWYTLIKSSASLRCSLFFRRRKSIKWRFVSFHEKERMTVILFKECRQRGVGERKLEAYVRRHILCKLCHRGVLMISGCQPLSRFMLCTLGLSHSLISCVCCIANERKCDRDFTVWCAPWCFLLSVNWERIFPPSLALKVKYDVLWRKLLRGLL